MHNILYINIYIKYNIKYQTYGHYSEKLKIKDEPIMRIYLYTSADNIMYSEIGTYYIVQYY